VQSDELLGAIVSGVGDGLGVAPFTVYTANEMVAVNDEMYAGRFAFDGALTGMLTRMVALVEPPGSVAARGTALLVDEELPHPAASVIAARRTSSETFRIEAPTQTTERPGQTAKASSYVYRPFARTFFAGWWNRPRPRCAALVVCH
jgi:hypothetical protein